MPDDDDGEAARVRLSKKLVRYLVSAPAELAVAVDDDGWVVIEDLLVALAGAGQPTGRAQVLDVVLASDPPRFALSDDGLRLRPLPPG